MKNKAQVRTLVFRTDADNNLLFTLLSFAASITITRAFLYVTGYPQVGGGEIHIAHVLWGGLIMFLALIILLLFSNRWIHNVAAVLSGIGVGLFIDEVGKFITQENNYFYPIAAPIIYVFFLLTLLIYIIVRRSRKPDARALMYQALEELDEYLDHDFSAEEAIAIEEKLHQISEQHDQQELSKLAAHLLIFLREDEIVHPPHKHSLLEKWQLFKKNKLHVWLPRRRLRIMLTVAWLGWGIWSIIYPIQILWNRQDTAALQFMIREFVEAQLIRGTTTLFWFQLRIGISAALGLMMIIAATLLFFRKDRVAITMGFWALLLSLTAYNLLLFYFDQFSTIFNTIIQFIILAGSIAYQREYLAKYTSTE
jgi:hypothetical protein